MQIKNLCEACEKRLTDCEPFTDSCVFDFDQTELANMTKEQIDSMVDVVEFVK